MLQPSVCRLLSFILQLLLTGSYNTTCISNIQAYIICGLALLLVLCALLQCKCVEVLAWFRLSHDNKDFAFAIKLDWMPILSVWDVTYIITISSVGWDISKYKLPTWYAVPQLLPVTCCCPSWKSVTFALPLHKSGWNMTVSDFTERTVWVREIESLCVDDTLQILEGK